MSKTTEYQRQGHVGHRLGPVLVMACAAGLLAADSADAQLFQRPATVIENARVMTMDGRIIENGSIIIQNGRITRVGTGFPLPDRANRINAEGMTITPGLIDVWGTLAYVGRSSGGNAFERASDAFNGYDMDAITEAWRNGVTAVYLPALGSPGINGTGAVMRLEVDQKYNRVGVIAAGESALHIDLGSGLSPVRRLANFQSVRQRLKQALEYRDARELYREEELVEYEKKIKERAEKEQKEGEKPAPGMQDGGQPRQGGQQGQNNNQAEIKKPNEPPINRQNEVILKALDRELPVRIAADLAEDILNALALKDEFGLEITIEGGAEAHLVAKQLARAKVAVVLGSMVEDGRANDADRRRLEENAAALSRAGVKWSIGSGGPSAFVLFNAQLAASAGSGMDSLTLLTAHAADLLDLSDLGRIATGKQADLVFWSGDPRDPASRVERVLMNGQAVYERAAEKGESQP